MCLFPEENQQPVLGRKVTISMDVKQKHTFYRRKSTTKKSLRLAPPTTTTHPEQSTIQQQQQQQEQEEEEEQQHKQFSRKMPIFRELPSFTCRSWRLTAPRAPLEGGASDGYASSCAANRRNGPVREEAPHLTRSKEGPGRERSELHYTANFWETLPPPPPSPPQPELFQLYEEEPGGRRPPRGHRSGSSGTLRSR